ALATATLGPAAVSATGATEVQDAAATARGRARARRTCTRRHARDDLLTWLQPVHYHRVRAIRAAGLNRHPHGRAVPQHDDRAVGGAARRPRAGVRQC